jgi:hypothetical protein
VTPKDLNNQEYEKIDTLQNKCNYLIRTLQKVNIRILEVEKSDAIANLISILRKISAVGNSSQLASAETAVFHLVQDDKAQTTQFIERINNDLVNELKASSYFMKSYSCLASTSLMLIFMFVGLFISNEIYANEFIKKAFFLDHSLNYLFIGCSVSIAVHIALSSSKNVFKNLPIFSKSAALINGLMDSLRACIHGTLPTLAVMLFISLYEGNFLLASKELLELHGMFFIISCAFFTWLLQKGFNLFAHIAKPVKGIFNKKLS